ncbi:YegP family protein [Pseudarthrobacter sp. N5]|uniref:YegP family protein n=1 Tax=Pseudarthrobacter sp. N5 TaxID=3418416 RepID=UPI003CFA1516
MAGEFEIHKEGEEIFRFRLRAADGTVVAVSPAFGTLKALVCGINAVRENAATGHIVDRSGAGRPAA